jgi:hypothetical protein
VSIRSFEHRGFEIRWPYGLGVPFEHFPAFSDVQYRFLKISSVLWDDDIVRGGGEDNE